MLKYRIETANNGYVVKHYSDDIGDYDGKTNVFLNWTDVISFLNAEETRNPK